MLMVHSIESMGTLDGPGLRTVIFLSGCPLRCQYCHNPDTWAREAGRPYTVESLLNFISRYQVYYRGDGGVTFSGGEPLLQAKSLIPLVKKLKQEGIHVALDTSGAVWNQSVEALLTLVDLVLLDVKHTDHRAYYDLTHGRLEDTLTFLNYLKKHRRPYWIRQVIIPSINDKEDQILQLDQLTQSPYRKRIELLAFHQSGRHKWQALGIPYPLEKTEALSINRLKEFQKLLKPE